MERKLNDRIFTIAGAALTFSSTILMTSYALQKKKKADPSAALLLAGAAGVLLGASLFAVPSVREKIDSIETPELMDDESADTLDENIAEILGGAADRGTPPKKLRQIELDESATIEDFM